VSLREAGKTISHEDAIFLETQSRGSMIKLKIGPLVEVMKTAIAFVKIPE
jgi:hypothetical protein